MRIKRKECEVVDRLFSQVIREKLINTLCFDSLGEDIKTELCIQKEDCLHIYYNKL